ncbi:MAG: YchF family ATPase [Oscillospiraceae bacterium]|jgi:GTP-binding protein YchF|nr:YchF family ATPase [Oscillospiraceae bacterium]
MKLGIIGLPGSGRRTLFSALTGNSASGGSGLGSVKVPDVRLDWLSELYKPKKTTPASVEFVLPLSNDRSALRQADALVHIVNCFDGSDPAENVLNLNTELLLSDIESVEKRVERAKKSAKGDKKYQTEADTLTALLSHLNAEKPARTFSEQIPELLTGTPIIYVANYDEDGFRARTQLEFDGQSALPICAKLESDLQELEPDERTPFLEDLQITETGQYGLLRSSYSLLGLMSFLTAGSDEVRAWTIRGGTKAPQAAGKVHSDIERGFIRAELIAFEDLKSCGDMVKAKEKGLVRLEGKEYIMKDGDVVNFRFNV